MPYNKIFLGASFSNLGHCNCRRWRFNLLARRRGQQPHHPKIHLLFPSAKTRMGLVFILGVLRLHEWQCGFHQHFPIGADFPSFGQNHVFHVFGARPIAFDANGRDEDVAVFYGLRSGEFWQVNECFCKGLLLQFRTALADICVAYAVGALWTLAFESPVITIEKVIFGTGAKQEKVNKDSNNNENGVVNNEIVKPTV